MRVLGLDLSLTSTGVAVIHDGAYSSSTTVKPGTTVGAARLTRMWDQLEEWWAGVGPVALVAIEGYSYASRATQAHSMGEWGGVVRYNLHRLGQPFVVIPPSTWRKLVLGRGNLAKSEVRIEVFKRYGLELVSEDALEAFCVAQAAYLQLTNTPKPKIVRKKKVAA